MRQSALRIQSLAIVLLLAVTFIGFLHCERGQNHANALAVVGTKVIDREYFIRRYKEFREKTGTQDTGLARRSVLDNLIAEAVLIWEARNRHYDTDPVGQRELERIKIQHLLNAYHRQQVSGQIKVSEDELRQLFINLNTRLKARHLYAPTKSQADSLYQLLQQGADFIAIAKTRFNDPILKESGGLVGYFTVDEMDPAFEDAAYALKVGEISQPVRTNDGYSIIRLEDRITKPLLTETEFAKHRSKLETYWKKRKTYKMTQRHVDSLRKELNVSFNGPMVRELLKIIKETPQTDLMPDFSPMGETSSHLKEQIIVSSKLGKWSVDDLQRAAEFTSTKERNWIRDEETLKEFIAGLVVRSYILQEAKKHKLHKTQEYRQRVADDFETALLERMEQVMYQGFEIPEDTLKHYYDEDPSRFAEPPRIQLQMIQHSNRETIDQIAQMLKRGRPFDELARRYSEDRSTAEKGGDLGYLAPNDLGAWSKQVLDMDIGEWIGPLEINSSYVLLKCVDKIPPKLRSFEQARHEVEKTVRAMLWFKVRQEKVDSLRAQAKVISYPAKLMEIKVN
ncbi:MAG: peptidylprolyl isomerase [candidate division KSB1 bacterium]|nr:peptidylprolyl isomerase [candidate division KSB1 bacterium]MDZ7398989.1 peptidylprolyl isomerase [candidate division KSB1 bacterium]